MIGRSLRRLVAWPLSLALAFGLVAPAFPVAQGAAHALAPEICTSGGAVRTQAPVGDPAPMGTGHAGACALCASCAGACAPPPAAGSQPALASPPGLAAAGRASAAPARAHWLAARPRAPPPAA